ncbi:MAG: helix-turn-helix transcriptional regulator [Spirochaetales bacterium]|nr:helix-turn-helix transcriptional regulator [Spirochaetales bacterium]
MDLWERLKIEIKRNNTTQEWVAQQIGISRRTFEGWFNNKTMPKADQTIKIAKALNTTVEYLVTGEKQDSWQSPQRYEDIVRDLALLSDDDLEDIRILVKGKKERTLKKDAAEKERLA